VSGGGGGSSRASIAGGGDGGSVFSGTGRGGGGGGGGGRALTVASTATAALQQMAAGAGLSGRVALGGGRWVDSLTAKAVDPLVLAKAGAVAEKISHFFAPDAALAGSNLHSPPELLLLRWAGWHSARMWRAMGGAAEGPAAPRRRLIDFERDFVDGAVLARVLLSHAPELGKPRRALDASSGAVHLGGGRLSAAAARDNARAVMAALGELHLRPPFTAESLCPAAFSGGWVAMGEEGGGGDGARALAARAADPLGNLTAIIQSVTAGAGGGGGGDGGKGGSGVRAGGRGGAGAGGADAAAPAPPSLTPAALALAKGPLVTPVAPLFDDSQGVVEGILPGTDRLPLRSWGGRGLLALGAEMGGSSPAPAPPAPPPPPPPPTGAAAHAPTRDTLYALLWLFSALPAYIPRALVDFKGCVVVAARAAPPRALPWAVRP
jgi:hypothetical protein